MMRGRIAFLAALTLALTLAPAWGWAKGEDDATEGKTTDDERAMAEDGVPVDAPSQYRSFASEEELRAELTKEARERGFEIPENVFEMSSTEEAMASLGVSSAGNATGDLGIFNLIAGLFAKGLHRTKLNGRWIYGCTRDACDTSWVSTGQCSKNCGGGRPYYKLRWNCNPWTPRVRKSCGTDGNREALKSRPLCNTHTCPTCDGWSDSSSCSVSCGGGKKTQTYKIIAKDVYSAQAGNANFYIDGE